MALQTTLRFSLDAVLELSSRYSYRGETAAIDAGRRARRAGFYTREDFLTVCGWKSPRTRSLWSHAANSDRLVREVTRVALSTEIEQLKLPALSAIRGVNSPTASVLLHFGASLPYPILDYRALWSLGNERPPKFYTFDIWWSYTEACRRLAAEAGVTMRELDRALWQYSKDHAVSGRHHGGRTLVKEKRE